MKKKLTEDEIFTKFGAKFGDVKEDSFKTKTNPRLLVCSDFQSLWEDKEKWNNFIKMFECVYSFFKNKNLYPMICFGTLLGCRRNGKQTPWDGDIDIALCKNSFLEVHKEFLSVLEHNGYAAIGDGPMNYKIYSAKQSGWRNGPWIDVDFWKREEEVKGDKATSVLNYDGTIRHQKQRAEGVQVVFLHGSGAFFSSHNYLDIFPLNKSVFEGVEVYVPNNTDEALNTWYPNWDKEYRSSIIDFKTTQIKQSVTKPIYP